MARYAPQGMTLWEIWNEPNLALSFPPAPDPVRYAQLLKAAHDAAEAVDPDVQILLGGLAPISDGPEAAQDPGLYPAVAFLEQLYRAGGGAHFDILNVHPYTYPELPGDRASWNGWALMTGPIAATIAAHDDTAKPLWITEFGAPTNDSGDFVNEDRQIQMLEAALEQAPKAIGDAPLFWYAYRDRGTDRSDREDWFGLLYADGTPKALYDAFPQIVAGRSEVGLPAGN